MPKQGIALYCVFFVICLGIAVEAEEKSVKRVISERQIAKIDFSAWLRESFTVSPDNRRVAYLVGHHPSYAQEVAVVVDSQEGKPYVSIPYHHEVSQLKLALELC